MPERELAAVVERYALERNDQHADLLLRSHRGEIRGYRRIRRADVDAADHE